MMMRVPKFLLILFIFLVFMDIWQIHKRTEVEKLLINQEKEFLDLFIENNAREKDNFRCLKT